MNTEKAEKIDTGVNTLVSLKAQRSTMKRNISTMKGKIDKDGAASDFTILECRLQILESYFKQLSHIQTQIEKLDETDGNRSDIEELFISAKATLVSLMNKKRTSTDIDQSFLNSSHSYVSHQSRLPQIKLPKFDGKYAEFARFVSTFKTLVHNEPNISAIDKFNYLLNCLSGQALAVIQPFQVIESNYQMAFDRLIERYDNKSLMFIDNINSLFAIEGITKPNATTLRSILDNVSALRSSLLSLGSELEVMNAIIIHIVLSKIDGESKKVYDEKQDFKSLPSWDNFYSILSLRCQFLESRTTEAESFQSSERVRQHSKRPGLSFFTSNTVCEYCKSKEHLTGSCSSYLSLPISRRFDFVKSSKLCLNCLRKGHVVSQCPSKSRCRTCRISHHTSLHMANSQSKNDTNISPHQPHSPSNFSFQNNASSNLSFQQPSSSSLQPAVFPKPANLPSTHLTTLSSFLTRSHRINMLPTAIVFIKDSFGCLQPLRALLDSCSEVNLITQEAASRLRLKQFKSIQEIAGVSDIRKQLNFKVTATMKSRISNVEWTTTFFVTKSISSQHPAEQIDTANWNIPPGIELADPQFYLPQRIDLLISSGIFFDSLLDGKLSVGNGQPYLIKTSLGWVLGGSVSCQLSCRELSCNIITKTENLDSLLKAFWEIEEFNQHGSPFTKDYILTLQHRCKWFQTCENIREGTLVIVHEDNIPPQHWLLARVIKAIPGRDGKVRVVDLQTTKGAFRRSIHKIAPLPIEAN